MLVDCLECQKAFEPRRRACFHCVRERRQAARDARRDGREMPPLVWCDWCGGSGVLQGVQACRRCLGACRVVSEGPSPQAIRRQQLAIATPVMVRERQWQDMEDVYHPGARRRAPRPPSALPTQRHSKVGSRSGPQ